MSAPVADANLDSGGADNAAAIQALLDAGRPLPPGRYGVGSTLNLHGKGLVLEGAWRGRGGPTDTTLGTWLVWQGPPGGTLLDVRGMQCVVAGVGLACARSTSLGRAVNVDAPDPSTGLISTRNQFERLAVDGQGGAIASGFVCGESQAGNGEQMRWESCDLRNCGAGVDNPSGTDQANGFAFRDVTFSECGFAYRGRRQAPQTASSSPAFYECNLSWCGCVISLDGGTGKPVLFKGCISEGCGQWCRLYGAASVVIEDCYINMNAAPDTPPAVWGEFFAGGNELALIRGALYDSPQQRGYVRPTNGGNLRVENVFFRSPAPFANDDNSRCVLTASGVRLADGAVYLPDGTYWCGPYTVYPRLAQGQAAPQPLPAAGVAA